MDKAQFWRLIEDAKEQSGGECEVQADFLKGALVKLPPEEIIAFGGIMDELLGQAYRWDVWGAAYLIKDSIVWGDGQLDCENIRYAAMEAHEEKTGQELPHGTPRLSSSEPVGVRWEEDDLDAMFPRIAAKINAPE